MHWVIQKSLFKPENYRLLTKALNRLQIKYSSVSIPNGTLDLEPEINPEGKVYICGAIKLKKIAEQRDWSPGSFLNDDFRFDKWISELGDTLLNNDVVHGKFGNIPVDHMTKFFIRPLEDNKAFDGMVLDAEMMTVWRNDPTKSSLTNLDVIVSPVKEIYREYRMFVVKNKVVTGSVYKISGKPHVSEDVEQDVIDYVNDVINTWVPSESVVIDVCLTSEGYKVIEFNNINSSGFYASNVQKYVEGIQKAYG
jgi:hypothetical protein